jgi:hypothetical protein
VGSYGERGSGCWSIGLVLRLFSNRGSWVLHVYIKIYTLIIRLVGLYFRNLSYNRCNIPTSTTCGCIVTPVYLDTMLANRARPSLFLLILYLGIGCFSLAYGRVLVRPSVSTLVPYNTNPTTDQYAPQLFDRSEQLDTSNVSSTDQVYNDLLSFLSSKRLQRRSGKQPAAATDTELSASAAKGCSMLYMLAANADDALTRLKTNPSLAKLGSSQSTWDNAGALKTYGWTEKKDQANWPYMGINDVMDDLKIKRDKATVNIQLLQDIAVTADGKSYVVSEVSCDEKLRLHSKLTPISGIERDLRLIHQCGCRYRNSILHLLAPPRSERQEHQRRDRTSGKIFRRVVSGILQTLRPCQG